MMNSSRIYLSTPLDLDAQFWLSLQSAYDLAVAEREHGEQIMREVIPAQTAA
jgi:plasmid maintenance system antidote protein VapI